MTRTHPCRSHRLPVRPKSTTRAPCSDEASAAHKLNVIFAYVLSPEGSALLAKSSMPPSEVEYLVERAAAHVSFQPRFLYVHLHGTADAPHAALPAMDSSGSADSYVIFRLATPTGATYPAYGVRSRTIYQDLRPRWNQHLELPLQGGVIRDDGSFSSSAIASETRLMMQVFDADVGFWGWLLGVSTSGSLLLVAASLVGHIFGLTDKLTFGQQAALAGTATVSTVLVVVSLLKSVYFCAEDDLIGEAAIPLRV